MKKFLELRNKYKSFIYKKYEITETSKEYEFTYYFEIPGLTEFTPKIIIKKDNLNTNVDHTFLEELVFHIGLVELISYVKCTCSPNIIIECGYLDEFQKNWFKKLYYNGLGEFLYINNINIKEDELFNIETKSTERRYKVNYEGHGNLIPIGGGKDSIVTLELLNNEDNTCFIINPKGATIDTVNAAGYKDNTITVKRILDKKIVELNNQGFLNGHTPFSALVAFVSYLCAYLKGKKYIILSNEDSANQSTVLGTNINHQYSKTYEFENDFNEYTKKYFNIDINYFSLLRPLTEFQIGMLFSNMKKYHKIFRSCNLGSKKESWEWCCKCPKCLFVYIVLSPFLYKEDLINIFGKDLYEDKDLLNTFLELIGEKDVKPFECVGTIEEVKYAVSLIIKKLEGSNLPYLLDYYNNNYPLYSDDTIKNRYNPNNNLNSHFEKIVKDAINNVSENN